MIWIMPLAVVAIERPAERLLGFNRYSDTAGIAGGECRKALRLHAPGLI
jgi:hypothetical protein